MIGIWSLGGAVTLAFWGRDRVAVAIAFMSSLAGALVGLIGSIWMLLSGSVIEYALPSMLPFARFALRLDGLGAFFISILSLVALTASIFSLSYAREYF